MKQCSKCGGNMVKGLFTPNVGAVGLMWTDKLDYSKWKFEKINKKQTYQYACDKCGYIESYIEAEKVEAK